MSLAHCQVYLIQVLFSEYNVKSSPANTIGKFPYSTTGSEAGRGSIKSTLTVAITLYGLRQLGSIIVKA